MSNLKTLKVGTEVILEVTAFSQKKDIEKIAPSVKWTIVAKDDSPETIGTGNAIKYKIPDKYAGKNVMFRAFIKDDSKKTYPRQCLSCIVEEKVSVEGIRIKQVAKLGGAKIGDAVECKVTQYNKPSTEIKDAQKRLIKWDVKVGNSKKMALTTDRNEPYRGETIKFIVPKSWSGKNVVLMPYMNQSTESVSANLSVEVSTKGTQKEGDKEQNKIKIISPIDCPYVGDGVRIRDIHPVTKEVGKVHKGVDLTNYNTSCNKQDVFATVNGEIIKATNSNSTSGAGTIIHLKGKDGFVHIFMHLTYNSIVKSSGEVSVGEKIATIGSTGGSTGPHLHYEIRDYQNLVVDPLAYNIDLRNKARLRKGDFNHYYTEWEKYRESDKGKDLLNKRDF